MQGLERVMGDCRDTPPDNGESYGKEKRKIKWKLIWGLGFRAQWWDAKLICVFVIVFYSSVFWNLQARARFYKNDEKLGKS